ncbi:MAG: SDR family NAD(P)-dependent oxidoreductase [Spirochaetaceae bacterium]|nr:SDR family NAD(P)-dependent oxidoreductase [Spirochaetaceae bacterium]
MRIDFGGRTVIVTGGSGALGGAVVESFLEAGARVLVTYVVEAEVAPFRERFAGRGARVELRRCDLRRADEVETLLGRVAPDSLRAVVNLAGGYTWTRVADADNAVLEHLLDLNLRTTFTVCRAAAPILTAAGGGAIVNVSARAALQGEAGNGVYGATKAAVLALTQALSAELKDAGVNVNAVLPSIIDTPANRAAMPNSDPARWVAQADLANVIVFLASDAAAAVHGAGVPVYGLA